MKRRLFPAAVLCLLFALGFGLYVRAAGWPGRTESVLRHFYGSGLRRSADGVYGYQLWSIVEDGDGTLRYVGGDAHDWVPIQDTGEEPPWYPGGDVYIELEQTQYASAGEVPAEGISYCFVNDSGTGYETEPWYDLQIELEGCWYSLVTHGFSLILQVFQPGEAICDRVEIARLGLCHSTLQTEALVIPYARASGTPPLALHDPTLLPGRYRVVKTFSEAGRNGQSWRVAAEFTILRAA